MSDESPAVVPAAPIPKGQAKPAFEGRFALPANLQAQADAMAARPVTIQAIEPGSFPDLLKQAIDKSGLSIPIVAHLPGVVVTPQTIRNWLTGSRPPRKKQDRVLAAIEGASAINVSAQPAAALPAMPEATPSPEQAEPASSTPPAKKKPGRPKKQPARAIQQVSTPSIPVKQQDVPVATHAVRAKPVEIDLSPAEVAIPKPVGVSLPGRGQPVTNWARQ